LKAQILAREYLAMCFIFIFLSSHYSLVLQFYVLQKNLFVNKLKAKNKLIY